MKKPATLKSAIAAYGEPEKLSIGEQTEIDLAATNKPIPKTGKGRLADILAMME